VSTSPPLRGIAATLAVHRQGQQSNHWTLRDHKLGINPALDLFEKSTAFSGLFSPQPVGSERFCLVSPSMDPSPEPPKDSGGFSRQQKSHQLRPSTQEVCGPSRKPDDGPRVAETCRSFRKTTWNRCFGQEPRSCTEDCVVHIHHVITLVQQYPQMQYYGFLNY
jgi:hypothetical protein